MVKGLTWFGGYEGCYVIVSLVRRISSMYNRDYSNACFRREYHVSVHMRTAILRWLRNMQCHLSNTMVAVHNRRQDGQQVALVYAVPRETFSTVEGEEEVPAHHTRSGQAGLEPDRPKPPT